MKKRIKKLTVFMLLALSMSASQAQVQSHNNDIWFHYMGKFMVAKKTSVSFEGVMRFANGFSEKQQFFLRPTIDYQFTKHFQGSLGYSYYKTFVYGSPSLNKIPIPEDHIFLQGLFTHQFGDLKLTNRLRDEQRWVGLASISPGTTEYKINDYVYRNRLRYMLLASYPIIKKGKSPLLSVIVGDEAFFNIGKKSGKTLMNQNRVILGLGYQIDPHQQVQVSFIQQKIWNFSNTLEETNPTVRFSYITNINLAKK
jgi:hypothetical protein